MYFRIKLSYFIHKALQNVSCLVSGGLVVMTSANYHVNTKCITNVNITFIEFQSIEIVLIISTRLSFDLYQGLLA